MNVESPEGSGHADDLAADAIDAHDTLPPWRAPGRRRGRDGRVGGDEVFRPFGAAGGLKDEFEQLAAEYPHVTKLVTIGRTVHGEDIVALKVSGILRDLDDSRSAVASDPTGSPMAHVTVGDENGSPIELHYTDHGAGPCRADPRLAAERAHVERQVPALVDAGHRVIAYDRRGFGRSSQP